MPDIFLDDRDRAILLHLQNDARLSNAELAERVNLSPSACHRRVRLLEESGLISGSALILDQTACGLPGNAFIYVSLKQQGQVPFEGFEKAIMLVDEVIGCYLLAGDADYMLHVVYRDAADLERLHRKILTELGDVDRIRSTLALRQVKRTTKLPLPGPR